MKLRVSFRLSLFWGAFIVVQLLSCVYFRIPWTAACQASPSFTISQISLKFMSIESVMPSNHLILCCTPLLLPSVFPSIRQYFFPMSRLFASGSIFGCAGSSLLHVGFLQLGQAVVVHEFLIVVASLVAEHRFQAHGLSSCGVQAQLPHGMQNLPGPGIKPMFPTLADKFLTTGPPGKSQSLSFKGQVQNLKGVA